MRFSIGITDFSWPDKLAGELAEVTVAAEDAGLDTVWVADHLLQADPRSTADAAMLEAYTTLGFLAARTSRVGLGTMVSAVTFRPPALLIKAVSTLDVLSGGRAGAVRDRRRAPRRRGAGDGPAVPAGGGTVRAAGGDPPAGVPDVGRGRVAVRGGALPAGAPDREPAAGAASEGADRRRGERKTLRLVARYADACNVFDVPDGGRTVRHKLAVLARHCDDVGRPYGEIEKTISTRLSPGESAASFAHRCAEFGAWGIEHAVVISAGPWSVAGVGTLGRAAALLD